MYYVAGIAPNSLYAFSFHPLNSPIRQKNLELVEVNCLLSSDF